MEGPSTVVAITLPENDHHPKINLPIQIFVGFLIAMIVVSGAIGNFVVMFAIASQRKLHSRANFLIASLAMTDFLVSILVTPFFAFMAMHDGRFDSWWIPEKITCQLFVFLDVACCTSSIYHLCAIAWVRYKTVSTISIRLYSRKFKDVLPTIGAVWLTSALLSFAPYLIFHANTNEIDRSIFNNTWENITKIGETTIVSTDVFLNTYNESKHQQNESDRFYLIAGNDPAYSSHLSCTVNSNKAYRVIATTMAFYGPLFVIVVIYIKMARVAWARISKKPGTPATLRNTNAKSGTGPVLNRCIFRTNSDRKRVHTTNYIRTAVANAYRSRFKFVNKSSQSSRYDCEYTKDYEHEIKLTVESPSVHDMEDSLLNSDRSTDNNNTSSDESCKGNSDTHYDVIVKQTECSEANKNFLLKSSFHLPRPATSIMPRKQYKDLETELLKCNSEENLNMANLTTTYTTMNSNDVKLNSSRVSFGEKNVPTNNQRLSVCYSDCGLTNIKRSISIKLRRERRVIKTLGMVIGAFIICWLPFFLKELILPFCTSCSISTQAETIINWMGYVNSALNPFIYAFSNSDFNQAFRKVFSRRGQISGRFFTTTSAV